MRKRVGRKVPAKKIMNKKEIMARNAKNNKNKTNKKKKADLTLLVVLGILLILSYIVFIALYTSSRSSGDGGGVEGLIEDGEEDKIGDEDNEEPTPSTPSENQTQDQEPRTRITREQAKAIALKEVPGEITDISIERNFGEITYVIKISKDGVETDVIVSINTGEVLGIES